MLWTGLDCVTASRRHPPSFDTCTVVANAAVTPRPAVFRSASDQSGKLEATTTNLVSFTGKFPSVVIVSASVSGTCGQ